MAVRDDDPWRLPPSVRGENFRLSKGGSSRPISSSTKARLRRIVARTPEVMVKVTGRTRGSSGHLKAHLDYVTRNGRVHGETQDGEQITDWRRLRELHDDWLLANRLDQRGKPNLNATQSVAIILSMPPGTPADKVEAASRTWARETLGGKHDWLMSRHDDTDHPHVHFTVRAVGSDGRRLAPGPKDLQAWREGFARELRRYGVEAEATPRQARGIVRKAALLPVLSVQSRGEVPRVRRQERQAAESDAEAPKLPQPRDWSRDIQARQDSIRRAYLDHADQLANGDAGDRRLGSDIQRFVADMPVPLTRRQAIAIELRRVLQQRPDRRATSASHGVLQTVETLQQARMEPAVDQGSPKPMPPSIKRQ